MKKIIALIIVGMVLMVSCAHQQDLSKDDMSKYRKAKQRYDAGQKGGP